MRLRSGANSTKIWTEEKIMTFKPILCLDFDGVIHSYSSGWKGADVIPDPPVLGAFQFIHAASKFFRICIYSSRSAYPHAITAMREWFGLWSVDPEFGFSHDMELSGFFECLEFPDQKPSAFMTIDDRALTFTGNWADFDPQSLLEFKPWNKK